MAKQHLLVTETRNEHEYDPERALRVWGLLRSEIERSADQRGYGERSGMTDDDRCTGAFELLDGSIFGDMIFSDLANYDVDNRLIERDPDE